MNTPTVALAVVAGVACTLLSHYVGDFAWGISILYGIALVVIFLAVQAFKARSSS